MENIFWKGLVAEEINHCPEYRYWADVLLAQSVLELTRAFHKTYNHSGMYYLFDNFPHSSFNSYENKKDVLMSLSISVANLPLYTLRTLFVGQGENMMVMIYFFRCVLFNKFKVVRRT